MTSLLSDQRSFDLSISSEYYQMCSWKVSSPEKEDKGKKRRENTNSSVFFCTVNPQPTQLIIRDNYQFLRTLDWKLQRFLVTLKKYKFEDSGKNFIMRIYMSMQLINFIYANNNSTSVHIRLTQSVTGGLINFNNTPSVGFIAYQLCKSSVCKPCFYYNHR